MLDEAFNVGFVLDALGVQLREGFRCPLAGEPGVLERRNGVVVGGAGALPGVLQDHMRDVVLELPAPYAVLEFPGADPVEDRPGFIHEVLREPGRLMRRGVIEVAGDQAVQVLGGDVVRPGPLVDPLPEVLRFLLPRAGLHLTGAAEGLVDVPHPRRGTPAGEE